MGIRVNTAAPAAYYLADRLAAERRYPAVEWARWDHLGGLVPDHGTNVFIDDDFVSTLSTALPRAVSAKSSKRVAAYDITVDHEKPISVLWALATDHRKAALEELHDRAVSAIIADIAEIGMVARRGAGGMRVEPVEMPPVARFLHLTARPTPMPSGRDLPAPHLHTQIVIVNHARRADGTWGAIDGRRLYKAIRQLEARRRSVIDSGLHALDLPIERDDRGVLRIHGIDPILIAAFSARRVALLAATRSIRDPHLAAEVRQRLALWHRRPKTTHSLADLETAWREEAEILQGKMRPRGRWIRPILDAGVSVAAAMPDDNCKAELTGDFADLDESEMLRDDDEPLDANLDIDEIPDLDDVTFEQDIEQTDEFIENSFFEDPDSP